MHLTDLKAQIGRNITLSPTHWAFAWLLGEARTASNPDRADSSHRGASGNQLVDMYGALGELAIYKIVRGLGDAAATEHSRRQLYIAGGGQAADGADLKFVEDGTQIGIDVKTFDCDPKKRYFAINNRKHLKLARDHCIGYIGLICAPYGRHGCLTRIIPYADVEQWPVSNLLKTPSRNFPIKKAMGLYCGAPFSRADSWRRTYSKPAVVERALQTGENSVSERLIRMLPEIEPAVREICKQHA
jgi:hypothetical protein